MSDEKVARKDAQTVIELLAEGYRAFVLQNADREPVTKWATDSLTKNQALRIDAGKELARLDELSRKVGRLENRCYVSARNLEFLKLILGNANGR